MRAERKLNKFKMAPMYRIDRGKIIFLFFCFISFHGVYRCNVYLIVDAEIKAQISGKI
jgi:hypothetical protein